MRRILLCAALIFAAIQVLASPVDVKSAQAKAQRFVQEKSYNGTLKAPLSGEVKLAYAEMNSKMLDRAVFYIFNTTNGYLIVSGDDRAEEILGYGDKPLDINTIPCNMRAWLNTYKEQIEYLQANEGMVVKTPSMMAPSLRAATVAPLLTALWNQEAPYWNQCKINGSQCLTGCPATSAAMVFHYWKYPDFETPEVPAYRCELSTSMWGGATYVTLPALPPVNFDWDNMLDSYSSGYNTTQANAVATLMRYVGQAEHMAYGTSAAGGSGVDADSVSLIADAFKFFGYDEETVRVVKKTSAYSGGQTLYTDAEWAALIQEELSEGRPIVFCAIAGGWGGGGHAFNVDGYDASTNKYHINFGWSGSYNNYYALNAFTGQGSTFNQYQQMVIGIQPPLKTPRLKVNNSELSMECYKSKTTSQCFTVTGRNLEGDVTLTLNDENNVFSISETTIAPDEEGKVSKSVTVTYAPKAEGNYSATITCSTPGTEDVVVTLKGASDYEIYRPTLLDLDQESITSTSFRADWADNTPAENVTGYTLEVRIKPEIHLLTEADWSNVPSESANHAADAANYMPDGWTFSGSNLYLDGGFLSAGRNSVITANCDMAGYSKVSIVVKAKSYTKGSSTKMTFATDIESKEITLAKEVDTYLVVLEVGSASYVKITTGYYPEMQSIQIYGGEITDLESVIISDRLLTANADYVLIEGITPDKSYTVTGLIPGQAYLYRVKAAYVNGTESPWTGSKEVILKESTAKVGDINGDGEVDVADVTALIDAVLTGDLSMAGDPAIYDVNNDTEIDIADVTQLISIVLGGN